MMIEVSAGVIVRRGRVLACQRPVQDRQGGLWEFPGGKRLPGETAEDCLVRECREELGITVLARSLVAVVSSDGQHRISFFLAEIVGGEPITLEHAALLWADQQTLGSLSFCPADAQIVPQIGTYLR